MKNVLFVLPAYSAFFLFRFRSRIPCATGALAMGAAGTARASSAAAGALPSAQPAKLASYNIKDDDGKYGNDYEVGHMNLSFLNLAFLSLCML